ncbi:UBX domain-containing protein 10 [Alosa pseudoharengus]|uniref:UBX domain-containing protein 10 n=1 Tax=Alosa pseudoharengus TaxID=34774 RepID=UPI003F8879DB
MHVSMPKSSKGRKRNKLVHSQSSDATGLHPSPMTPRPPLHDRCTRSRGNLVKRSSLRTSSNIPELVEAISVPVLTLNKYRVLPSIEKKPEREPSLRGMEEKTSKLSLSDNFLLQLQYPQREQLLSPIQTYDASKSSPEMSVLSEVLCRPGSPLVFMESPEHPAEEMPLDNQGSLMLAIRTPCGIRIEHRFNPDSTLRSVIAAAKVHQGRGYTRSVVETMDMPRRTFTDLNMTLAQCGILNRSVLCISHVDFGDD